MLNEAIAKLVQYGLDTGLVPASEKIYATNLLLECMKEDEYTEPELSEGSVDLEETLRELLDEAVARGLIEDNIVSRDLFDTKLMNCLVPRPAQVQNKFWEEYSVSPKAATDYYYKFSKATNYIRTDRIRL